MQAEKTAEY